MDITLLILSAIKPVWWVFPLAILVGFLRTSRVKGIVGETLVKFLATIKLPKKTYHPIHNVTVPSDNSTTQIDHIYVSRFGVFVVETKHLKGWIFGSERQSQWTQQLYREKYKFQNPLRQNYKHVIVLESLLEIPGAAIISVVAFTGDCRFKTDMPPNVTYGVGFIRFIKSFRTPILSDEQVLEVIERIQSVRLKPSRATDKLHVLNLQSRENPDSD